MTCRTSYILPTIGGERLHGLRLALHNAADLLGPDDELIVVDAELEDRPWWTQLLRAAIQTGVARVVLDCIHLFSDGSLRYLPSHRRGIGANYNDGLRLATGRYIRLLADDDLTYPDGMARVTAYLETHPKVDMLYCRCIKWLPPNQPLATRIPPPNYGHSVHDPFIWGAAASGQVFKRRVLEEQGYLEPTILPTDVEFMARLISKGVCVEASSIIVGFHTLRPPVDDPLWDRQFWAVARKYGVGPAPIVEMRPPKNK